MLKLARRASDERTIARRLLDAAVAASRQEDLYADLGAPDTPEGRFELMVAHVTPLLERLAAEPAARGVRQALFDAFVGDLDAAMREMGVGDLAMAKRMRRLGEVIYGRLRAYDQAFAALPDRGPVESLVARTILDGLAAPAGPLAERLLQRRETVRALAVATLCAQGPGWP